MIIPSRWFTGGRGLDEFRNEMLRDNRIRTIHDFIDASNCFPGVEIKGGVCFFIWNRDEGGLCDIITHINDATRESKRPLLEDGMDIFIRYSDQISILKKVQSKNEPSFENLVSANDPYGFDVREEGSYKRVRAPFQKKQFPGSIKFYYNGWRKEGVGYVDKKYVRKGHEFVDNIKIFVPRVWGTGNANSDWVNPFIVHKNACSTETFLSIGPFTDQNTAENVLSYMGTKFFHFMISLVKNTQQAMQRVYRHVPTQDFSEQWSDKKLYAKYGLTEEEIAFIESMIRPMDLAGGDSNA